MLNTSISKAVVVKNLFFIMALFNVGYFLVK